MEIKSGSPEHYDIFRKYIQHEDDLIHQRLSWNLTIHGFLFAAYGLLVQKVFDNVYSPHKWAFWFFAVLTGMFIPTIGALVGVASALSVKAARTAIGQLENDWYQIVLGIEDHKSHEARRAFLIAPDSRPFLPGLTGGGSEEASDLGHRLPKIIPWIFAAAWSVLLFTGLVGIAGYFVRFGP